MPDDVTPENTPSPAEERIAAIIAQRDNAATQAGQLEEQNRILATRLAALENQVAHPPKPTFSSQENTQPAENDKPLAGQDIAAMVQATVRDALAPVTEKIQASEAQAALQNQQAVAYQQAVKTYPGLEDSQSPLSQVAQKIWNGRPDLASLPDAPVVIATMAQGALAEAKLADKVTTERKQQASIVQPAPVSDKVNQPEAGSRREVINQVREKVQNEGVQGSSANRFADLFRSNLTETVAESQGE